MVRTISVVIPTVDRQDELTECLEAILVSDCNGLTEILIVDDGSRRTPRVEVQFPQSISIGVHRNSACLGPAMSRNLGAREAQGEILAFLDDDSRVCRNWFSVVQHELTEERAAITGPVIGFDVSLLARARQRRYDDRYRGLIDGEVVDFMAGGNCAIWRSKFLEAGGFPPLNSLSDQALALSLRQNGSASIFVWDLKIAHRNDKGLITAVDQAFEAGRTSSGLSKTSLTQELLLATEKLRFSEGGGFVSFLLNLLNCGLHICFVAGRLWGQLRPR